MLCGPGPRSQLVRFESWLQEIQSIPLTWGYRWYKKQELGRRNALFWIANPIGQMFAGYLQAAAYTNLNNNHGLQGWRSVYHGMSSISMALYLLYMDQMAFHYLHDYHNPHRFDVSTRQHRMTLEICPSIQLTWISQRIPNLCRHARAHNIPFPQHRRKSPRQQKATGRRVQAVYGSRQNNHQTNLHIVAILRLCAPSSHFLQHDIQWSHTVHPLARLSAK